MMGKYWLIILTLTHVFIKAQVIVICHPLLNNEKLTNASISVKQGNSILETFNMKKKTEFMIELEFGKVYRVYMQHTLCPVMYFEVFADNIPADKRDYTMSHVFNAHFVYKNDDDIDTTVFQKPFYKILFDGKKKMVDDTAYNNAFAASILRKPAPKEVVKIVANAPEQPSLLAGKVFLNARSDIPVKNKKIYLVGKNGKVLKSTYTNRYGAFAFTGVFPSQAAGIKMEMGDGEAAQNNFNLADTRKNKVMNSRTKNGVCEWPLSPEEIGHLRDDNYTTNIGGKLVSSSPKEKKFYSNKDVYLSNKLNTVIKKTKTNILGTFVFEDIKPDHQYYIGVDKNELVPGEKIDLLSKEDHYIATLDTVAGERASMKMTSNYNKVFNEVSIGDEEMKMDIKATIFGDNVNNPIGKLKIVLLNDNYEVIDSALTDNLGTFKFKYLPFLKRFYLSAENTDNILDVFKNILIYSSDNNLIKIMTHQKGKKFSYKPVSAELSSLRDIELEDPWLEFIDKKDPDVAAENPASTKTIIENVLFESAKYDLTPQAREIMDKIILVMNTNKSLKIEVHGHTDSKGSAASNMKLSEMRAQAVSDYIISAGVARNRVISSGFGESKLLNHCGDDSDCSDMEHAQNRRIEFKILSE